MEKIRGSCPERKRLSKAVTEAVEIVFRAKAALDAAIKGKLDSADSFKALAAARKAESKAVAELHRYKNTHGC